MATRPAPAPARRVQVEHHRELVHAAQLGFSVSLCVLCGEFLFFALATLLLASLLFLIASPAQILHAQTWNSHLEGMVLDPSGAAVPAASLELRNPATGTVRRTETEANGFYSFPLLPIGNYELEIAKPGFVAQVLRGLALRVGETARLDIHLEIEHARTRVEITTEPPLVEAASPAIGDEIENRRVSALPLNGRQFSQLALLAAGATPPYPNGTTQQFNTPALGLGFSVNGQRAERNNFSLDGVTLMEPFAYSLTVNPSIDAIREFRVVEDSYGVDQGITSGAQVNIASRSGANRLAGTAYEFVRNSALDAKNFFDDPARSIPPYRQNQFGASLGGPIRPNRTFFFANYEGLRIRQSVTNTTLLPTAALRQGDFNGINPETGNAFPAIINPASGQPFQGNAVPASQIDPLSRAILARIPLPNEASVAPGANNDINVGLRSVTSDEFLARIDHELTPKHQLFARFLLFDQQLLFPFVPDSFANNPSAPAGFGTYHDDTGRNAALGFTSVFRPTLINDFRFGYAYYYGTKEGQNIHSGFLESLGITRAPGATNDGIPAIDVPGYADLGDSDIFQPQIRRDNTFQFTDNLAWVRGRHTWKFGADLRRYRLFYQVEDFGQGLFDFSDGASSVSGTAFSDFLLGRPFLSYAQAGNSGGNDRLDYFGAYFSDEFHATRRLTLTYGLREEFYSPPTNADGRASILDPSDATPLHCTQRSGPGSGTHRQPAGAKPSRASMGCRFITSQQAGLPPSLIRPDWAGWAPRVGFAYDPAGAPHHFRAGRLRRLQFARRTRLCLGDAAQPAPSRNSFLGSTPAGSTARAPAASPTPRPSSLIRLPTRLATRSLRPSPRHPISATATSTNGVCRRRPRNCAQYRLFRQLCRVRRAQTSPPVA